ncbi:MAG: hypothetical protein RBT59_06710 [Arcobacteraceae bacterium]|jgi:hypothetical protein|nr:hypothetical protein [Arcobacteraceae bacterium]
MLEQRIKNAVKDRRLKLIEGKKDWYGYRLLIQKLVWVRNNDDGYLIDVYNQEYTTHFIRVKI